MTAGARAATREVYEVGADRWIAERADGAGGIEVGARLRRAAGARGPGYRAPPRRS